MTVPRVRQCGAQQRRCQSQTAECAPTVPWAPRRARSVPVAVTDEGWHAPADLPEVHAHGVGAQEGVVQGPEQLLVVVPIYRTGWEECESCFVVIRPQVTVCSGTGND